MIFCDKKLTAEEVGKIVEEFGDYIKVTADIEKGWVVLGPELHVDAVPMLKEKGSVEENIWGGWINFIDKEIETSAVWNIRPQLNNPSMEILDPKIREKFESVIREVFEYLWK